MDKSRKLLDYFFLVIKGIAMGAANKVPGISGGIVAFVGGFYEEFIYSLQKVNSRSLRLLFTGKFRSFYQYINGSFLFLLISGMLISYFSVARLLDYALERKELFVWAAFFGLIIGSIIYIYNSFSYWNPKTLISGLLGLFAGISLSFLSPAPQNENLFFIFLCGIVSVSGMTLPGLSGSFLLILMGNYVLLLVDSVNALYDTISEMLNGDFSFTSNADRVQQLKILAVFTLGSLTGLVTLSHLLGYVLRRFNKITTALIIGFITGSLGLIWPWKESIYKRLPDGSLRLDSNGDPIVKNYRRYLPDMQDPETWWAVGFILLGIAVLLTLEWYGENRQKQKKKIYYGLIGRDIGYSFSREYFNNKFRELGKDQLEYVNFDLDDIRDCRAILSRRDIRGLNVTIPYKQAIIPFLDELDPLARSIGAVNTIHLGGEKAIGFNTDALGFKESLLPLLKEYDRKALLLGTGGASKAIKYVMKELGVEVIQVSRTPSEGQISYRQVTDRHIQECTLIVNTTPLGGSHFPGSLPEIPYSSLSSRHLLYDLTYKPERTPFLMEGISRGCRVKNGWEMLVLQAEAAWEIWNSPKD